MPAICSNCGQSTTRYTSKLLDGKFRDTCYVCENPRHNLFSGHGANMFSDLTLTHVTDERGQPVRVTSRRQLHEAETRYKFRHHAANYDEANWDKPPQMPSGSIQDNVRWLYPELAERMLKDPEIQAEMKADRELMLDRMV